MSTSKTSFVHNPSLRFLLIVLICTACALAALHLALEQPRSALPQQEGITVQTHQGPLILEKTDLMPEPGDLSVHAEFRRFLERQEILSQNAPSKDLRTLSDVPLLFWIQLIVGLGAFLISGWIWALRPRDAASTFFVFSGFSTFLSALPSAVYTSRSWALPAETFHWLVHLNSWGAALFGVSMIALFLVYPHRLPRWKTLASVLTVIFLAWATLHSLQLTAPWAHLSVLILTMMICILIAIGAQFFATRGKAQERASLTWLGLAVLTGAGSFVAFNSLPLILGMEPLNQGYAFLFFLIIYLGLAAGLTQYRLFDVGNWAFKFLFYSLGAMGLVLLDAGLIYMVGVDRLPALGLAVLIVGFAYLPLRDSIQRFLRKRELTTPYEFLPEALNVVFARSEHERTEKWLSLLKKVYNPLELQVVSEQPATTEILDSGLTLLIPAVAGMPAIRLKYPEAGQGLFSPSLRDFATQMSALVKQADSSRESYDRGVSEERQRMAQDLHDDLGARLLSAIYSSDEQHRPLFQSALDDVRAIVSEMSKEEISLARALAETRHEVSRRLTEGKVYLDWPLNYSEDAEKILISFHKHKTLKSSLREIVSNVLRHSQASHLHIAVALESHRLHITVHDNGVGIGAAAPSSREGHGLQNIKRRWQDVGGSFDYESGSSGTRIILQMPLSGVANQS
ncbi:ATP-binding protein [Bdellovibrio bacteriovorus]|uniref:histidine kinase n=1 Tax=Bdellovibrio bacteriovorus TaxID=959 RepID=A0A1Z3N5N1_BDEBC|nr:ATP-binding protein [Bdellovibrio bacteriovorus]ASD62717.1 hypothetical protein B9G79_03605 [Bdellovibrio bacteriovorus]